MIMSPVSGAAQGADLDKASYKAIALQARRDQGPHGQLNRLARNLKASRELPFAALFYWID